MSKPVLSSGSGPSRLKTPAASAHSTKSPPPSPAPHPRSKGGYSGFIAAILVLLTGVCLFLYYLAFQAEDMSDIAGYQPPAGTSVRNLKGLLAVGLSSGQKLTITEEEINRYLAATLKAKQAGTLSGSTTLKGIAVRLEDGYVEVVVERELFGHRHTVATHLIPSQKTIDGQPQWDLEIDGGKFGRLNVSGQLLLITLRPIQNLGSAYSDELRILQHASSIRVEDGRVLLGPVNVIEK